MAFTERLLRGKHLTRMSCVSGTILSPFTEEETDLSHWHKITDVVGGGAGGNPGHLTPELGQAELGLALTCLRKPGMLLSR